jgi:SpoVK/Ycf46/Vps4 family AAA+-type ATPase
MIHELNHTYSTRTIQIRRAIDLHREWIEERLGVSLSEAVIIETDISFYNAALPLLGYHDPQAEVSTPVARVTAQLQTAEVPPSHIPCIELTRERASRTSLKRLVSDATDSCAYSMNLIECPVFLKLQDLADPLIAMAVKYHPGPYSSRSEEQDIVVIPRSGMERFIALLKTITRANGRARLKVGHEEQIVSECNWDQLVLDPTVVSMLKDDFESFFLREDWFRKMGLPYRRGYLLHGPPGNGKSSAIRAMLTSRGLTAYTIRFFDEHTGDEDLEHLFARAAREAPAVVLLEDIDRCFPRTGQSKTKISLQALLNCLDGVSNLDGTIAIATANEPTALDPAILRRPGRFDRVICFANPTPELRRQYFANMHASFGEMNLDEAVEESAGFSFAQLREAFIMAAQVDFGIDREIKLTDLLSGIWSLRGSLLFGNLKATAGFAPPAAGRTEKR